MVKRGPDNESGGDRKRRRGRKRHRKRRANNRPSGNSEVTAGPFRKDASKQKEVVEKINVSEKGTKETAKQSPKTCRRQRSKSSEVTAGPSRKDASKEKDEARKVDTLEKGTNETGNQSSKLCRRSKSGWDTQKAPFEQCMDESKIDKKIRAIVRQMTRDLRRENKKLRVELQDLRVKYENLQEHLCLVDNVMDEIILIEVIRALLKLDRERSTSTFLAAFWAASQHSNSMRQKTFNSIYLMYRMAGGLEQFSLLGSGGTLLKRAEYAPIVNKAKDAGLAEESISYGGNETTQTASTSFSGDTSLRETLFMSDKARESCLRLLRNRGSVRRTRNVRAHSTNARRVAVQMRQSIFSDDMKNCLQDCWHLLFPGLDYSKYVEGYRTLSGTDVTRMELYVICDDVAQDNRKGKKSPARSTRETELPMQT